MDNPDLGVDAKTRELFSFAGKRTSQISSFGQADDVIATIEDALRTEYGDSAYDIAFHLSDWISDAAFIVAIHLWPEKFTAEEIREGVEGLLIHAPNHLAAAAALAGRPVVDVFGTGFKVPPEEP